LVNHQRKLACFSLIPQLYVLFYIVSDDTGSYASKFCCFSRQDPFFFLVYEQKHDETPLESVIEPKRRVQRTKLTDVELGAAEEGSR
jgi:hypothetical protein